MESRSKLFGVISDFLINLAAGWFGAMFIVPAYSNAPLVLSLPILIVNFAMGMLFLFVAYKLR